MEETPIVDVNQRASKYRSLFKLASVGILVIAASVGVAFGLVQSSHTSHAYAQISQLQSEINSMQNASKAQRNAASNANLAHLGICVTIVNDPATGYLQYFDVQSPVKSNDGVYSCNGSGSYVSVVPQISHSG